MDIFVATASNLLWVSGWAVFMVAVDQYFRAYNCFPLETTFHSGYCDTCCVTDNSHHMYCTTNWRMSALQPTNSDTCIFSFLPTQRSSLFTYFTTRWRTLHADKIAQIPTRHCFLFVLSQQLLHW